MERRSRFEYGTAQAFECTVTTRPWAPADNTVGGSRISAAGIPAAYVVRRDGLLDLTLRFWESEWTDLLNLVAWGQAANTLTWFPEATDLGTSWDVYLDSPAPGSRFGPSRDGDFPRVMELTVTLRGAGTGVPWLAYFQLT